MRKHVILLAILLAGCTTTKEAQQTINTKWQGKSLDEFTARYGAVKPMQLADGQIANRWQHDIAVDNAFGPIILTCVIDVFAAEDKTITGIHIIRETAGIWDTSLCNEIFSQQ